MYTGKLSLTNKKRVPLSLTNNFDDIFGLEDELKECKSAEDFLNTANRFHIFGYRWKIDKDNKDNTRLVYADKLGNIHYLIATKKPLTEAETVSTLNFKTFMEMYDNWNGITKVNDNNLKTIVKDKTLTIMENRQDLFERKVIAFGFYDGELTVRVN